MKTRLATLVLSAAIAGVPAFAFSQTTQPATTQPAAVGADVPVKEVVLYSSGVGYFEHYGTINGNNSTELRFKTNQINDILKSLVLQDMDGGNVAAVTYPSLDPIAKTLKSFQVDITANPPLADLLNQLRGAKVTLTVNGEKTTGVVLGVEKKQVVVKGVTPPVTESVLNLVSGGKIISQPMDAINSIELEDPKLQDELNQALVALAGARDQDKKPVKINFTGAGERHVRLGYVVETPIWKTSYRLLLGDKPAVLDQKGAAQPAAVDGKLQGWAIVENQTDNDWNNVQLSLVSGRPISFVEDLYQPLYIPRPVVEPELFASLRPQTYAGGVANAPTTVAPTAAPVMVSGGKDAPWGPPGGGGGGLMPRHSFFGVGGVAKSGKSSPYDGQDSILLPNGNGDGGDKPIDAAKSISSVASATSLGELFEYTVGSVTLPRQRSAMIPIITDPIEVERVSIYNQRVLPRNPLNGARVKNTTKKHLLAGPITVLDGATYAGDAQIDNVPPGQERFLSYGVDLQMLVDAKDDHSDDKLQTGKIIKGVLYLTHKYVRSQGYSAENKSDHDKVLIVEHPRQTGWDLVDSPVPMEKTDDVYRFKETVPTGKNVKLTVSEQIVQDQTVDILSGDFGTLDFYHRTGEIPKPVQDALAKAIGLKQAVTDTDTQIAQGRQKLTDIDAEQGRIRSNLNTVHQTGNYYTRLMTKLDEQETTIEKTKASIDDLQKKRESQMKELNDYLSGLNVG